MVALAAHKLLEDVMQIQRIRPQSAAAPAHATTTAVGSAGPATRTVLTMEDLAVRCDYTVVALHLGARC
jgi:hypothetical protein